MTQMPLPLVYPEPEPKQETVSPLRIRCDRETEKLKQEALNRIEEIKQKRIKRCHIKAQQ